MSIHGEWECQITTQWDSTVFRFQNKFNLNTFIYGCVNDIVSNSGHTMSSSYHKKSQGFHGGVDEDSILLKRDVASPITQWHNIIDQEKGFSVHIIITAFCVHLDISVHWGSPGFTLNRYIFPAEKATLRHKAVKSRMTHEWVLSLGMQVSKYIYSLFNDIQ
jgi:hypothetical protein